MSFVLGYGTCLLNIITLKCEYKKRAIFVTIIVCQTSEEVIGADESRFVEYLYRVIDEVAPEAMSFGMMKW